LNGLTARLIPIIRDRARSSSAQTAATAIPALAINVPAAKPSESRRQQHQRRERNESERSEHAEHAPDRQQYAPESQPRQQRGCEQAGHAHAEHREGNGRLCDPFAARAPPDRSASIGNTGTSAS
jgi:hypothetical protein